MRLSMEKKIHTYKWLKDYIIYFFIGFAFIVGILLLRKSALIWGADGTLMYNTTANYAKTFWSELLHGNIITMDLIIGEGENPIHCMTYYGLLEPWNIIYVITPESWCIVIQSVFVILKCFVSGLAMAWYLKRYTDNQQAISVGVTTYVFSGYFMFWLQAPSLLNVGFLFPLLIGFLEDAIQHKRCVRFILLTAVSYLINYYVAAVMSCMLLLYAIVYLTTQKLWTQWKQWIPAAFAHAVGIMMAGIILLPCIWAILQSTRIDGHTGYDNWFVFPWQYYLDLIRHMFHPMTNTTGFWQQPHQAQTSFLLVALPSLIFLFTTKEKNEKIKRMRTLLVIFGIILLVPAFSRLLHGNSFTTHRWTFALAMVMSCATAWAVPRIELKPLSKWIWIYTIISGALGFLFVPPKIATIYFILACIISLVTTFISWNIYGHFIMKICVVIMVCGSFLINGYALTFYQHATFNENNGYQYLIKKTDFDKRAAQNYSNVNTNNGTIMSMYTNMNAWNLLPATESEYYSNAQILPDTIHSWWPTTSDDRTSMLMLGATEYYIASDATQHAVPYGFEYLYTTNNAHIYQNQYNPGLGYIFYNTMRLDTFKELNIADRQLALLNYAITDNVTLTDNSVLINQYAFKIPYSIKTTETQTAITFDAPTGYELYMHIGSVIHTQNTQWKIMPESILESANPINVELTVKDSMSVIKKSIKPYRGYMHLHHPHPEKTVALGHLLNGTTVITMDYEAVKIQDITLYAIPTLELQHSAEALIQNQMTNVQYKKHQECISGHINATQDGVLQIAIPYSDGWKMYVDGKETEIFTSGIKYIGAVIPTGEHDVILQYEMPLSLEGLYCTGAAVLITTAWFIVEFVRKNKVLNKNSSCTS